jgi:hypothetical protein
VSALARRLSRFRRVVIWGHPLHSHTHSYVHEAFARAFQSLGAETIWTDEAAALADVDLRDTLFLTEGQVCDGMPDDPSCRYVLHNVEGGRFAGRALALQVYTAGLRERSQSDGALERIDDYTYLEAGTGCNTLYQPWGTDLLPHEFDLDVALPPRRRRLAARGALALPGLRAGSAAWVGTIGAGRFGNIEELIPFQDACRAHGVEFVHRANVDRATHIRTIRASLLAPAIVGRWQLEHGYVPCRIFKNISYGRLGVTNSRAVQDIFESEIPLREDGGAVFDLGVALSRRRSLLRSQIKEVRARHTYVNRIAAILEHLP